MCRVEDGYGERVRRSDGKGALRACIECGILLGARGILSKAV